MKKLILRWVGLAVFLSLVGLACVRLGEWQLDRLAQRQEANAVVLSNENRPAVPWTEVMGEPIADDAQWQQVTLSGTYTGEQYQVRYRNHDRQAGIEVAAVFETTRGDEILIDRGFIPRQSGQPDTEVLPPPPTGEVSVLGYVHRDERGDDTAVVPHEFKVRLINSEAIGTSLGRDLVPGYVVLRESTPDNGADLVPLTPPVLDEGNHFSYALQWFAFGVIAVVGIAVLIRADLKDRRKDQERERRLEARRTARKTAVGADAAD